MQTAIDGVHATKSRGSMHNSKKEALIAALFLIGSGLQSPTMLSALSEVRQRFEVVNLVWRWLGASQPRHARFEGGEGAVDSGKLVNQLSLCIL